MHSTRLLRGIVSMGANTFLENGAMPYHVFVKTLLIPDGEGPYDPTNLINCHFNRDRVRLTKIYDSVA